MSKQFRFYLTPSDIEHVLAELRSRCGVTLIASDSDTYQPKEIESPFNKYPARRALKEFTSVYCYLVPPSGADLKMRYVPNLKKWLLSDDGADVIQFSGCIYDGSLLEIGRLYFQTNMLIGNTIWPRRKEFISWADKVFRTAKKLMRHSGVLQAYIGKDAYQWGENGGRFVSFFGASDKPIYAEDERLRIN